MRTAWLVIGLCLLVLALNGYASVPSGAKVIELDQSVTDLAPGAYYKVQVSTPGTLAVALEQLPEQMKTRIIILDEADNSLADKITDSPGQPVTVQAKVDAPGWYYIGVMDLNGKSWPDPYVFRVTLMQ
jgi:hypothetical protein